jgi:hypothetical protein
MLKSLANKESYSQIVYLITYVALITIFGLVFCSIQQFYNTLGPPAFGDLQRFWAAGGLLSQGENPHDLKLLSQYSVQHGAGEISTYLPFYYPRFAMAGLLPFALFSYQQTRTIYLTLTIITIILGLVIPALRRLQTALRQGKQIGYELLVCATFWSFFPALLFLWNGAMTFYPFIGLTLFLCIEKFTKNTWRTLTQGAALTLTLIKPSVCYLALVFIIAHWFRKRRYLQLATIAFGFFALWSISWILMPELSTPVLIQQPSALDWETPTLVTMLQQYMGFSPYTRFVPSITALIVAALFGWNSKSDKNTRMSLFCLWIPASLVFVPYAWTYDFIMLALPMCYLLSNDENQKSTTNDIFYPLAILAANLGMHILPISMHRHWWYPVVFLFLGVKFFWSQQSRLPMSPYSPMEPKVVQSASE